MSNSRSRTSLNDEGFGLVEIVVSMFVLAILALSFLPVLVHGLKQSAENATLASATQVAEDQLVRARDQGPSCLGVTGLDSSTSPIPDVTTPRGVTLGVTLTVGACPSSDYGSVEVTVDVVNKATSNELVSAKILIYVEK